jgi:hypothetical protein
MAAGDEIILSGKSSTTFIVKTKSKHLFNNYSNNGFRQEVRSLDGEMLEIKTSVDMAPMASLITYPLEYRIPGWLKKYTSPDKFIQSDDRRISALAKNLSSDCNTQYQVVQNVIRWVKTNIEYRLDSDVPKTASDVLRKKTGYCIGYSNLTTALLRAAGIPARNVHGIFIKSSELKELDQFHPLSLNDVTLHRWIEVYYPDIGWVFSDPYYSANHITGNYIFLKSQSGGEDYAGKQLTGTGVMVKQIEDKIIPIDIVFNKTKLLYTRPNIFVRTSGMVTVMLLNEVPNREQIEVVLASLDGTWRSCPDDDGKTIFLGLQEGEYELKIRYNGKLEHIEKFKLGKAEELIFEKNLKLKE